MSLTSGSRLGPYEILSPLGAGGMGEVYKARDMRLERTVAIKILPSDRVEPELKARFEREAKAIAALQHPHICTLLDVGHHDETDYLVLEYLDGETLAARIDRGSLKLRDAITIAIQIADALNKAHGAGIVHRDLKPANVMVTKGGVKLLDFGLAKLRPQSAVVNGFSAAPTISTPQITGIGSILGTLQYMSPEQIEGREADSRADIWAFGCITFEMITGSKRFSGASQASLIAAIMNADLTSIPASTAAPPELEHIISRCLATDRDARWQSVYDLKLQLEWITRQSESMRQPAAAFFRQERNVWLAGTLVLAAGLSLLGYDRARKQPSALPLARFQVSTPATTDPLSLAVSPDGTQLAFAATSGGKSSLWLRPIHSLTPRVVAGTEDARYPFWSPDGQAIGFFAQGKLKRVDLGDGGSVRTLCDAPEWGGTWNRQGVILFGARTLFRVSADGGIPTELSVNDAESVLGRYWPHFLPDGEHFLYYVRSERGKDDGIYTGSLRSVVSRRVVIADSSALYSSPGYLLFMRRETLLAQRFDIASFEPTGEAVPVAEQVARDFDMASHVGAFAISKDGVLAYREGDQLGGTRELIWFDRSGAEIGRIGTPAAILNPDLSRDGRRVAFELASEGKRNIWIIDTSRPVPTRLTFEGGLDLFPVWAPRGDRIIYSSLRRNFYDLYQKALDASGGEELVLQSLEHKGPYDWSPDGRFILYGTGGGQNRSLDIWVAPTSNGRKPFPFANAPFDERAGQFSPDGKWVAYQSDESGRFEIYVRPFADSGAKWRVSTGGGVWPRWRRDGKELFYISPEGSLMSVGFAGDLQTFTAHLGADTKLFQTRLSRTFDLTSQKQQYVVTADGHFLLNLPVQETAVPLTVVLNWQEELKQRVPTR